MDPGPGPAAHPLDSAVTDMLVRMESIVTMAKFLHEQLRKGNVVMQSAGAGASAFELRAKSFREWITKN